MKITTTCGTLRAALHRVKIAARGNREGAATLTVRAGEGEVQMSGGGTLAKAVFQCEGDEKAVFKIVLNGSKALAVLATANDGSLLELDITAKEMRMKFESANIRIPAMDSVTDLLSESTWETCSDVIPVIKGLVLKNMLAKVVYAAARGDVRHYLNSINFCEIDGEVAMVATNGHILSAVRCDVAIPAKTSMLIPVEVADAIPALIDDDDDVNILLVGDNAEQLGFGIRTKSFELKTPLLCGQYPDWRRVMPEKATRQVISTNGKALAVAIERVKLASMDSRLDMVGVQISFTTEGVKLKDAGGESSDLVQADTGILGGSDWLSSFNPAYLLASLKHVDGNVCLVVDDKNPQTPMLLSQEGSDTWGGLVMPLNV